MIPVKLSKQPKSSAFCRAWTELITVCFIIAFSPQKQYTSSYCILEAHFPTHPTHLPSQEPTKQPTYQPSKQPTHVPSYEPTNSPTYGPSLNPTQSTSLCRNNVRCHALELQGECCPSSDGVFLDCCDQGEITPASCSVNAMCAHLTGQCCPTEEGVFLACCNGGSN